MNLFWVFLGGGLGSIARYGTGALSKKIVDTNFPFGTLLSNVISCFILGILVEWLALRSAHQEPYRLLVAVGFCGGFSTFSSFTLETFEMLRTGNYLIAFANIFGSVLVCLVSLWAGTQALKFF
jgi:fluoride exporter